MSRHPHCLFMGILTTAPVTLGLAATASAVLSTTAQPAYVVPSAAGVSVTPLISNGPLDPLGLVADEEYQLLGAAAGTGYRLVGIPDGMGAYDNGDGTFSLLVNHELNRLSGEVRAHGQTGAFISQWTLDKTTLNVVGGRDLITTVVGTADATLNRLCSADLPEVSAFYNAATGLGTQERIYMTGEEDTATGRAFGTVLSSRTTYYLPHLGQFAWENALANPFAQDSTIVVGTDDASPGQVYVYVGTKQSSGTPVDQAGLTNGHLYGVKAAVPTETVSANPAGAFTLHPFGNVSSTTGPALNASSVSAGVTNFARPEDGAWDLNRPNDFYFVTTGNGLVPDRLYRMRFNDSNLTDGFDPTTGGQLQMLLDGSEGTNSMDNMTLVHGRDGKTRLLIQEDASLGKIWMYTVEDDSLLEVAALSSQFFSPSGDNYLTSNVESSGIIPAWDILGEGWYLLNVQAHYGIFDPYELVEGGQVLAMYIPQSIPEPATPGLVLATLAGLMRRRRG